MSNTAVARSNAAPKSDKPGVYLTYVRAFGGLVLRDFRVLRREIGPFLIRTVMNPLLFLFVFTYVFPRIGQGAMMSGAAAGAAAATAAHPSISFGTVLLPGLMAVAIMFSGIAAVALPLATEFGITREIEDRVMCPLPVSLVAIEKVCFSALQSIVAACAVFPLAYFIPTSPVAVHVTNWFFLAAVMLLAGLTAGVLGLTIGTSVEPRQIGLIFSIVVIPITFLGCVYYPWAALYKIRWLQMLVLANPIVYMSEGLRASLTPSLPHMPAWLILLALTLSMCLLGAFGIRGFLRRVQS